jgi:hypothetical protein
MEPRRLGTPVAANLRRLLPGMADVSYPMLQGKACTISHNCSDEAARSSWVTDSWNHVFVLVQGQRARQLHCMYTELVQV